MTFYFDVNSAATTSAEPFYRIKELFKTAGWSVISSGDGLSAYSSSADVISSFSSGANGVNTRAWFVVQHPVLDGYQKSVCFQESSTIGRYRIKISISGFSGGSPSATVVPSATDEMVLYGAGTDASPTGDSFVNSTATNTRMNYICGDASEKWVFFFTNQLVGAGTLGAFIMMDRLTNTNSLDVDPYFYFANGSNSYPYTSINAASTNDWTSGGSYAPFCYIRYGFSDQRIGRIVVGFLHNISSTQSSYSIANMTTDPYTGNDITFPAMAFASRYGSTVFRNAGYAHYKGTAVNVKLQGNSKNGLDTSNSKTLLYTGIFVLPWNGSTPTI